jgi:hypothetical protein
MLAFNRRVDQLWPAFEPARRRIEDLLKLRSLGGISGAEPYLRVSFKDSLLLRVRPAGARNK